MGFFQLPWPLPLAVTQSGVVQCVGCERRPRGSALHRNAHMDTWHTTCSLFIHAFRRHSQCNVCASYRRVCVTSAWISMQALFVCFLGFFCFFFLSRRQVQSLCTTTAVRRVLEVWWIFTTRAFFRWRKPGCWEHRRGNTHFSLQSTEVNKAGEGKKVSG